MRGYAQAGSASAHTIAPSRRSSEACLEALRDVKAMGYAEQAAVRPTA